MLSGSRNDFDAHDRQGSPQHHNGSFRSHRMIKRNDLWKLHASVPSHCVTDHLQSGRCITMKIDNFFGQYKMHTAGIK